MIVMELAEGNLEDYIQVKINKAESFTLEEIKGFLKDVLSSLVYLQSSLQISHRDLKPENILVVKNGRFKVGDLDDSHMKGNRTREKTLVFGTLEFMAPELIKAWH